MLTCILELIDKCVGSKIWVVMKGDKGMFALSILVEISWPWTRIQRYSCRIRWLCQHGARGCYWIVSISSSGKKIYLDMICSDYSGNHTKLSKILLNGNNICMVMGIHASDILVLTRSSWYLVEKDLLLLDRDIEWGLGTGKSGTSWDTKAIEMAMVNTFFSQHKFYWHGRPLRSA